MNPLSKICLNLRPQTAQQLRTLKTSLLNQCSTSSKEEIVIPKRIQRGPTDILKALSNTVGRDYTAPHYKYHDDPYLIPMSNISKRTFALAKEAGRKAAQWIRQEHPTLFQHKNADPPVQDFFPRATYDENSEVDEDTLKSVIKDVCVSDAIKVYQLLEQKGQDISLATKQSLLELVCFYNCQDTLPEDHIEERWFRQGSKGYEKQRKTWKDGSFAEKLFESMDPCTPEAYCTLLQGLAQYCHADRAWKLYEEAQEKGIPLTAGCYSALIRIAGFLREAYDLRWKLVEDLLTAMTQQGLSPNLRTMNAVLEALSGMGSSRMVRTNALRTLAECKRVGIEPSLASYYYVLVIFCKERGPVNPILADIMNHIDGMAFTIQDPKDTHFFVTAMGICRNHLQDKDLALRVDKLLHTANNYDLVGDSFKESVYYRHLFALLCATEPLEVFMEWYNKFVPNIYIPEPGVMEEVIKAVDMNGAAEHFPRLWSDMVTFDHTNRESLVAAVMRGMVRNKPPVEDTALSDKFATVAWDLWKKIEERDQEKYSQLQWTGSLLGDVMILSLRANEFAKACEVLIKLDKQQHKISGVPSVEALQLFLETCITRKDIPRAIWCVQYSAEAGFVEAGKMGQQLLGAVTLTDAQLGQLTNIVGREVLQPPEVTATVQ